MASGRRRVNFFVEHLIQNKDGTFNTYLPVIVKLNASWRMPTQHISSEDPKIIGHPVVSFVFNLLWTRLARYYFLRSRRFWAPKESKRHQKTRPVGSKPGFCPFSWCCSRSFRRAFCRASTCERNLPGREYCSSSVSWHLELRCPRMTPPLKIKPKRSPTTAKVTEIFAKPFKPSRLLDDSAHLDLIWISRPFAAISARHAAPAL